MISRYIRVALLAGAITAPLFATAPAFAHMCDSAVDQARGKIAAEVEPQLAELRQMLQDVGSLQNSASKQALVTAVRNSLTAKEQAKAKAMGEAEAQVRSGCTQRTKSAQEIVDAAVRAALAAPTAGLSLVLPERMLHIDLGEILSGNLMGGENSIVREIINKRLGLPW